MWNQASVDAASVPAAAGGKHTGQNPTDRGKLGYKLQADEMPVCQLDPGSGKTRQAYLWTYRSGAWEDGPPIVVFDYQPSRAEPAPMPAPSCRTGAAT